jgi:hypothetical protein
MMRATRTATRLLTLTLLCATVARAQGTCPTPPPRLFETAPAATLPSDAPAARPDEPGPKALILSDNQEHLLTGVQLKSMGVLSDEIIASVAMRSPLAHVGGRLLFAEALRFGRREDVDLVLHLGDAADISCPDELSSVFDVLDKEAPRRGDGSPVWFMAPGNHDGILLGTYVNYQIPLGCANQPRPENLYGVYDKRLNKGLGHNKRSWFNACLSPTLDEHEAHADLSVKGMLTRGDAIKLYLKRLAARGGFESKTLEQRPKEDKVIVEGLEIDCKIERHTIKSQRYTAITRICQPREVGGEGKDQSEAARACPTGEEGEGKDASKTWVGPYASFIVQKLEVGGSTIIMLDTADYEDPTSCYVGFTAHLTEPQTHYADVLLGRKASDLSERAKVVVAGHHPLKIFPRKQREWIMERATRYVSGHTHKPTRLIKHRMDVKSRAGKERLLTEELNVGSTLDYPPQAVVAKLTSSALSYRVAGADVEKTKWGGFLDVCMCRWNEWRLPSEYYKNYRSGTYVNRLREALAAAAGRAPSGRGLEIPSGDYASDWKTLHDTLGAINESEGEAAQFWACQAFYASEATREDSWLEWLGVQKPPCSLVKWLPI